MTTYGLTTNGFIPKTTDIVRTDLKQAVQNKFGLSVDVSDGSLLGQLLGILAERYGELWDLAQAVNSSMDPDAASNTQLESLAALTGTLRLSAKSSVVTLTLTGTPATLVSTNSQVKAASTGTYWVTTTSGTITLLASWAPSTLYAVGDRRTNAGRCYQCTVGGFSAGSGGPTTTAPSVVDNAATWTYLGDGTGAIDVSAKSQDTGIILGVARDLTVIQTPVGGWTNVINVTDATLGSPTQSDESLRVFREAELAQAGTADPEAIRSAVLAITGVTSCTVFSNNMDLTTGTLTLNNVMTPHSVEVLVVGGNDQAIANVLFTTVAAGITYIGNTPKTVVDSKGVSQTVKFSRPTALTTWVDITYTYDATKYPSDGDTQVKAAIAKFGQAQDTGKDAVASSIAASIFPVYINGVLVQGVAGILDVTATLIGPTNPPVSSATLSVSDRQQASFDTSRITVHSSAGTV